MGRSQRFANQALRFRLARSGCTNRPFYHIVVTKAYMARDAKAIDRVGSYDPLPNDHNERLVAINFEKLHQWLNRGVLPTKSVAMLLGLAGFFPIHPMTEVTALRNRKNEQRVKEKYGEKPEEVEEKVGSAV